MEVNLNKLPVLVLTFLEDKDILEEEVNFIMNSKIYHLIMLYSLNSNSGKSILGIMKNSDLV